MSTMLKKMMFRVALMLTGMVGAVDTGTLVTFSSMGPDAYPDGTTVVDGEYYALAWAEDSAKLVMSTDGTVAEGRVLAKVSVAEGGRCPPVNVKLDAETARACQGGEWGVFLLDTRGSIAAEPVIHSVTRIEKATIEITSNGFLNYMKIGPKLLSAPGITDGVTVNPVAAIGTTGYASLADAVAAAQNGDTITLLADDTVSLTSGAQLAIDKSITIAGAVDANGEPLYTISGTPTQTGTNNIYIDGSGTVTLSDLKIAGFGNDHATDESHAPVYVASTFTGTVNLDNLYISDFNRGGLFLYGGTFNVTDCYIDCANSRSGAFTKGIEIRNAAAGTIADTTIVNMTSESEDSVVCGVEFYGNGDVTVSGCTIEGDSWGAVGIGTAGFTDTTTTGTITVEDCEITVYYAALYASVLGEGLGENRTTIKVTGGDYTADNYAVSALYGTVEIEDGLFSGMLEVGNSEYDENGSLSISGGLFDDEILAEYCAEGYIPSPPDPETGLYTVVVCILYPTGNTAAGLATAGVPIPDSWITANGVTGETTEKKIEALGQNGANGVPKWQSYVLGLNPNKASSKLTLNGGKAAADGTVTITGLNVAIPATLDAATTVGFHLEEATPADAAADKWTARSEACVMAEGKPTFTVPAEAVSGKVLRIVADIKTEAK